MRRPLLYALLAAVAGLALYLPAAAYGFAWDDLSLIRDNRNVHDFDRLGAKLTSDFFTRSDSPERIGHWRPLVTASFMIDWALGTGSPRTFHLHNALLHGIACGLLVLIAVALGLRAEGALAAALLFAAHPVHVESVAWISGRTDLICGVLVLGALWLDLCAAERGRGAWRAGAAVATLSGLLAKEMAVVVPFAVAWRAAWAPGTAERDLPPSKNAWRAAWPHLLAVALYAVARFGVLGIAPKASAAAEHGRLALFATWWSGFLEYLRVLVWPWRLSIVPPVALETSLLVPRVLLGAAVFLLLAAAGWRLRRRAPAAAWALAGFLASFAPLTNFIVAVRAPAGVAFPWAERFLFVPSLFAAVACAWLLLEAPRRSGKRYAPVWAFGLAILAVAALAGRTLAREPVWRNQLTLFDATVRESPGDAGAHVSLGAALLEAGESARGEAALRRALELAPDNAIAHFDLGNVLRGRADLEGAEREYAAALAARPDYPQAMLNLGIVRAMRGRYDEAERLFRDADAAMGGYPEAKVNLEILRRRTGRSTEAVPPVETAPERRPD